MSVKNAVVAGSIVLDITPVFPPGSSRSAAEIFAQGKYNDMDRIRVSLGGCVANTGISMHRLGTRVKVVSKVGDDVIGGAVRAILDRQNVNGTLAEVPGCQSTATVIIAPPNTDRVFLHSRGAAQTFVSGDITPEMLSGAHLFHFGYPTAMKHLYANGGEELVLLLRKIKEQGLTVSVDSSLPDPQSEPGGVDWERRA